MDPLKVPTLASASSHDATSWFDRIPWLRAIVRHRRYRRRRSQIIQLVIDQLRARDHVREQWREDPDLAAAASVLFRAIQSVTGIRCEKVIGEDPVNALFIASIDELESVEVMFDLEAWLGSPIDPDFFYESFEHMTIRQACNWLAENRKAVQP